MKKVFSVLLTLAVVLGLSLVAAPVAAYSYNDYTGAITNAADRLVALQGTDAGWDWVVTNLTAHSASPSSSNLYGVTGLGLIDAYQETSNSSYLDKAKLVADHIAVGNASAGGFWTAGYGYAQDYRFLMAYAAASGDSYYSNYAVAAWAWQKANIDHYASAEVWWTYVTASHSAGISAWQGADCGLAALAMGDTSWASDMAEVVSTHLGEINSTDIYRFIGWGNAIALFQAVGGHDANITALIGNLRASQRPDGGWGPGSSEQGPTQDTAYAVMGLAAVGAEATAQVGADWLVRNQIANGGWIETDSEEYSEVDSEALQAIKAVLDISGSVSMSAAYIPQIGISVSPLSVDFGDVTPGIASPTRIVTLTNTGNVAENFSVSLQDEVPPGVYTNGLKISGWWVSNWGKSNVAPGAETSENLVLTVPSGTNPSTYTATLVFWAELT